MRVFVLSLSLSVCAFLYYFIFALFSLIKLTFVLHSHSLFHIFVSHYVCVCVSVCVTMVRVMCDMCNNVCINKIPNSFAIKSVK